MIGVDVVAVEKTLEKHGITETLQIFGWDNKIPEMKEVFYKKHWEKSVLKEKIEKRYSQVQEMLNNSPELKEINDALKNLDTEISSLQRIISFFNAISPPQMFQGKGETKLKSIVKAVNVEE